MPAEKTYRYIERERYRVVDAYFVCSSFLGRIGDDDDDNENSECGGSGDGSNGNGNKTSLYVIVFVFARSIFSADACSVRLVALCVCTVWDGGMYRSSVFGLLAAKNGTKPKMTLK